MRLAGFTVAALLSAVLVGCDPPSSTDGDGERDMAPDATLENPLPFKSIVEPAGWSVKLGATDFDATERFPSSGSDLDEPEADRRYVTVSVTATNLEQSSKLIGEDLDFGFASRSGELYGRDDDDRCPKLPDALGDQKTTTGFATVTGEVCVSVPSKHVESGVWVVTDASQPEVTFYIEPR